MQPIHIPTGLNPDRYVILEVTLAWGDPLILQRARTEKGEVPHFCVQYRGGGQYFTEEAEAREYFLARHAQQKLAKKEARKRPDLRGLEKRLGRRAWRKARRLLLFSLSHICAKLTTPSRKFFRPPFIKREARENAILAAFPDKRDARARVRNRCARRAAAVQAYAHARPTGGGVEM